MEEKLNLYLLDLIKKERISQNLSLDQLSSLCNISKSYLSKLENFKSMGNTYILNIVLNKLGINYVFDEQDLEYLDLQLNCYIDALLFGHTNLNEHFTIINQYETKYLCSKYITNYLVSKYTWFVNEKYNLSEILEIVDKIEYYETKIGISKNFKVIYLIYQGICLINSNQYTAAINKFTEVLKCDDINNYSSIIYYYLSLALNLEGDFENAIKYSEKAQSELRVNFNNIVLIKNIINQVDIYLNSNQTKKSIILYLSLIKNELLIPSFFLKEIFKKIVFCFIEIEDFNQALFYLRTIESRNDVMNSDYFFFSICYCSQNDLDKASEYYIKMKNTKNKTQADTLKLYLLSLIAEDSSFDKNKLLIFETTYMEYENMFDLIEKKIILKLLVDIFEENNFYKKSLHYFKKRMSIKKSF